MSALITNLVARKFRSRWFLPDSTVAVIALVLTLSLSVQPTHAANWVVAWGAGNNNTPNYNNFGQSIIPTTLTNAVFVVGGWRHSLALKANGLIQGWGDDASGPGQLDLPSGSNYLAIACGYLHSVALQTNGVVVAAGANDFGQTGIPNNLSNVVAIACGFYHSLALNADGTVAAWGPSTNIASIGIDPDYGQTLVPAGLSNVVAIAGGGWHSLALKADGTLTGWGRTDYGQAYIPSGVSNVVAIAAGAAHSLVLEANGRLVAWGDNTYGQTNIPAGLSNIVAIAAGGWHNLALKNDGSVVAWGAGTGSDIYVDCGQNVVPAGLSNVVQIACGSVHSLALIGTGPPAAKTLLTVTGFGKTGFTVALPTRNGRVYRLEYKNSLTNVWRAFPLHAGLGNTMSLVDPSPSTPQRYYRTSQW